MRTIWPVILVISVILLGLAAVSVVIRPLVFRTASSIIEHVLPQKAEHPSVDITEFDAPLVVKFDAQLPGYTLTKNPLTVRNLQPMLARLDLYPMKDLPFLGEWTNNRWENARLHLSPTAVFVTFRSMKNWPDDAALDPTLPQRIVQSIWYHNQAVINFLTPQLLANNTQVALTVYVDIAVLEKTKTDLSNQLTGIAGNIFGIS